MTLNLFQPKTQAQVTKSLADYLPNGKAWAKKHLDGSNLNKLLIGLSLEILRSDAYINTIASEYDIRATTLLIEEWENAVGIPDECFSRNEDLDTRRKQVLMKLSMAILTREDFINLAAILGYTVKITGGSNPGVFTMTFPIMFFDDARTARFTMIVDLPASLNPSLFTLTFPFTFGPREGNIIECLFNKLKPANVQCMFRYIL